MEDVTDIGFRQMCKRFGAAMVYTEFVSADAIIRNIDSTLRKMVIDDRERPVGVQIYGRDVASMVEAARIVEQVHPDVIDINFGCPVKKVAGKGAGAGMLRNIPLMLEITRAVVDAVKVPVTVKTRGIPLKMGEAARWRRVCRMPRYSSMRSTLMRNISSSTSILSSMVSPLPVFASPLSPRLISSKIHGQPKVARPTITPSTPYCSNRLHTGEKGTPRV